jgi:hypothetical protein
VSELVTSGPHEGELHLIFDPNSERAQRAATIARDLLAAMATGMGQAIGMAIEGAVRDVLEQIEKGRPEDAPDLLAYVMVCLASLAIQLGRWHDEDDGLDSGETVRRLLQLCRRDGHTF